MARKYNVDWAGAYAAYRESKLPSVAQFYRERLTEFVIDGDKPSICSTYDNFRTQHGKSANQKQRPSKTSPTIRRLGSRLQIAAIGKATLDINGSPSAVVHQAKTPVAGTMHVRLPNGAELAFETEDPGKFACDLIFNASRML